MRCSADVAARFKSTQARAIAGEANMECGSGQRGRQEGPAFGLGLLREGGLSALGSKAQPVVRMGGDKAFTDP